eukprot:TRINITY_DN40758_c0_g1_i1.p1 TRINITY_DN40758_c0_g1~~TRINITY_DN40758_c0_g1_i1.p1  ORF type:complete len:532 (-),score=97.85 TRINITY_DN40758_c0_g1_i1:415-2010(-)
MSALTSPVCQSSKPLPGGPSSATHPGGGPCQNQADLGYQLWPQQQQQAMLSLMQGFAYGQPSPWFFGNWGQQAMLAGGPATGTVPTSGTLQGPSQVASGTQSTPLSAEGVAALWQEQQARFAALAAVAAAAAAAGMDNRSLGGAPSPVVVADPNPIPEADSQEKKEPASTCKRWCRCRCARLDLFCRCHRRRKSGCCVCSGISDYLRDPFICGARDSRSLRRPVAVAMVGIAAFAALVFALMDKVPHRYAALLASVLGWLSCYAIMLQIECRRLLIAESDRGIVRGITSQSDGAECGVDIVADAAAGDAFTCSTQFSGAPNNHTLCDSLDLTGYAGSLGLMEPKQAPGCQGRTMQTVMSAALVSEYLRCVALLKRYKAKFGTLPNAPACDPYFAEELLRCLRNADTTSSAAEDADIRIQLQLGDGEDAGCGGATSSGVDDCIHGGAAASHFPETGEFSVRKHNSNGSLVTSPASLQSQAAALSASQAESVATFGSPGGRNDGALGKSNISAASAPLRGRASSSGSRQDDSV